MIDSAARRALVERRSHTDKDEDRFSSMERHKSKHKALLTQAWF